MTHHDNKASRYRGEDEEKKKKRENQILPSTVSPSVATVTISCRAGPGKSNALDKILNCAPKNNAKANHYKMHDVINKRVNIQNYKSINKDNHFAMS